MVLIFINKRKICQQQYQVRKQQKKKEKQQGPEERLQVYNMEDLDALGQPIDLTLDNINGLSVNNKNKTEKIIDLTRDYLRTYIDKGIWKDWVKGIVKV